MRLKERNSGVTIAHLRVWALVCLTVGLVGLCVVLRGILGINESTTEAALTAAFTQEQSRNLLVAVLICQGVYTCAVPLFSLLLVEGSFHTGDFSKYLIRALAVAVVAEVPFDLATKGVWLDTTTLNPAFGTVLALVMMMFFLRYRDHSAGSIILRVIITAAVLAWSVIMNVEEGPCIVLITSVLWNFPNKSTLRLIVSILAGLLCCLFNMFYVATPLAMILIHFYNGEKGADFKWGRLVAYPGILALLALCCAVAF